MTEKQEGTGIWLISFSLLVMGLLLFIWPAVSGNLLCYIIGIVLCGYGIFRIALYFGGTVEEGILEHTFVKGFAALVAGIFLFIKPEVLASVLPVIFGGVLLVGGFFELQVGLDLMRLGMERWYISVIVAAVICILGFIAITNPFRLVRGLMRFIGVSLILESISALYSSLTRSSNQ